jgi:hypothetical protein
MLYRMSLEFRLTRLVPWADDGENFYDHVESVRAKIGTAELVEQVRAITDMAESRLNLDFLIEADRHPQAIATASQIVREAIESNGARHFGMEEGSAPRFASAGARSGLDIPIWHYLRMLVDIAA